MSCTTQLLTGDFTDSFKSVQKGLRGCEILLANIDEIKTYTIDGSNPALVTEFTLSSGNTAKVFPNFKQLNTVSAELVQPDDDVDGFTNTLEGVVREISAENLAKLEELRRSQTGVVAIVKKLWQGTDKEDTFEMYGLTQGLVVTAMTSNSQENITITLSSREDGLEDTLIKKLLISDFDTTNTAFGNKFLGA